MARRFQIEDTITRRYSRFNAMGTHLVVHLLPPSNAIVPVSDLLTSVDDLFRHALQNLSDSEIVGITIHNRGNQKDKPLGISFRRKDKLVGDVICSIVEEVSQSHSTFNDLDKLIITVHCVIMPLVSGLANKSKGRPLSVMPQHERSVMEVKRAENCLFHAIIITIEKAENDPDYKTSAK